MAGELLDWYDRHARKLPWRVSPEERKAGQMPDPYRVWLSEIMLQQTTVAAVKAYYQKFTERWPTVGVIAQAEDAEVMAAWAGLGYYARARNLLKCARIVAGEHDGKFPETEAELMKLPGIGPYTAAAVAAIAFDQPATVLDGNVERVMARLDRVKEPLPKAKEHLRTLARTLTDDVRPGDYAQAVMDLGATVCTPRSPACGICPWSHHCQARVAGQAQSYPRRAVKTPKPVRYGVAYVVIREDGAVLLERRPDKGLLGGMLGWPGGEWREEIPVGKPPVEAEWRTPPAEVRHTFTHFHLRLSVRVGQVLAGVQPRIGAFYSSDEFAAGSLPTVMRKVWNLARH
ncbi:MAG: A/G-specific adenine glycosylase [Rhodobacteraceae bacterium]|nr:A/G-specific adenine glycosylase [Paracoccaceae bacterium]